MHSVKKLESEKSTALLLQDLANMRGLHVECTLCEKNRFLPKKKDPQEIPSDWSCSMGRWTCEDPEENPRETDPTFVAAEGKLLDLTFSLGSVVWALLPSKSKRSRCPWFPGIIQDDPNTLDFYWPPVDIMRKGAEIDQYFVMFFTHDLQRHWVKRGNIKPWSDHQRPENRRTERTFALKTAELLAATAASFPIERRRKKFSYVGMAPKFLGISVRQPRRKKEVVMVNEIDSVMDGSGDEETPIVSQMIKKHLRRYAEFIPEVGESLFEPPPEISTAEKDSQLSGLHQKNLRGDQQQFRVKNKSKTCLTESKSQKLAKSSRIVKSKQHKRGTSNFLDNLTPAAESNAESSTALTMQSTENPVDNQGTASSKKSCSVRKLRVSNIWSDSKTQKRKKNGASASTKSRNVNVRKSERNILSRNGKSSAPAAKKARMDSVPENVLSYSTVVAEVASEDEDVILPSNLHDGAMIVREDPLPELVSSNAPALVSRKPGISRYQEDASLVSLLPENPEESVGNIQDASISYAALETVVLEPSDQEEQILDQSSGIFSGMDLFSYELLTPNEGDPGIFVEDKDSCSGQRKENGTYPGILPEFSASEKVRSEKPNTYCSESRRPLCDVNNNNEDLFDDTVLFESQSVNRSSSRIIRTELNESENSRQISEIHLVTSELQEMTQRKPDVQRKCVEVFKEISPIEPTGSVIEKSFIGDQSSSSAEVFPNLALNQGFNHSWSPSFGNSNASLNSSQSSESGSAMFGGFFKVCSVKAKMSVHQGLSQESKRKLRESFRGDPDADRD
ncbi:unnamed protein product [Notodromas monacha]|uniref:CW-type domain-containing protein n=1 Tax=Notodromas monacha TaxID=399045 RepID=A0A7R9BRZ8_9CRUS|nr:unnamed protein product [Notodromas monacha]CAG0920614.1 unnamed protein product [Notodromas monacha]